MSESQFEAYLTEIFSSFQGEGGIVRGSCFGKRQIFIRFSGCNIAKGAFNTSGCFWCDSIYAQDFKIGFLNYEVIPGSQKLEKLNNPVDFSKIIEIIENLITPDLHSISFTGGEPLYQLDFILGLSKRLKDTKLIYPLYLETNGSILPNDKKLRELANYLKFCCCDIKDRSSKAASLERWKKLVEIELEFISKMVFLGVETFAKIVITSQTQIQDIQWISKNLSKIKYPDGKMVGLAIQPVYFDNKKLKDKFSISQALLNDIFNSAAEYLKPESLTLSIQAHKYLKLL